MNANQMLKKHGEKLFNALDMAVNSLDDLETLVPILIQLGYSHYTWGVRDNHFQVRKLKVKFPSKSPLFWQDIFLEVFVRNYI